jgi:hypothetical protein
MTRYPLMRNTATRGYNIDKDDWSNSVISYQSKWDASVVHVMNVAKVRIRMNDVRHGNKQPRQIGTTPLVCLTIMRITLV